MKKTVLTFGLISGAISSIMMVATIPFMDRIGFDKGMVIGYTTMVLAFMLVFFGIRSYRDNVQGGLISFGKAFKIGILITLISCACYVITWEILYFNFLPDFLDKYAAHAIEKMKTSGATEAAIQAKQVEMAEFGKMYQNPLINAAFTFLEPFPVGLLFTAISALVLKKKAAAEPGFANAVRS
ncbi:MAG TPA: DUF4199 domain-containing protein [Terriglobales bacterium]|nr:DUF4199 domain-containing protein [Terriglobales bacterium]